MKRARAPAVDLEQLRHAFETGTDDLAWYLDSKTGAIFSVNRLTASPERIEALVERDPARYKAIPAGSRLDLFADMERFTSTVGDEDLSGRLDIALKAENPNRRFKDLLATDLVESERWVDFRANEMRRRALSWLQDLGIEAT